MNNESPAQSGGEEIPEAFVKWVRDRAKEAMGIKELSLLIESTHGGDMQNYMAYEMGAFAAYRHLSTHLDKFKRYISDMDIKSAGAESFRKSQEKYAAHPHVDRDAFEKWRHESGFRQYDKVWCQSEHPTNGMPFILATQTFDEKNLLSLYEEFMPMRNTHPPVVEGGLRWVDEFKEWVDEKMLYTQGMAEHDCGAYWKGAYNMLSDVKDKVEEWPSIPTQITGHVHVALPSGAVANVSPDASPELLDALDRMCELAKNMPDKATEPSTGMRDKWINVETRPAADGYYIIYLPWLGVIAGLYDHMNNLWYDPTDRKNYLKGVTHYRTFPAAPSPEPPTPVDDKLGTELPGTHWGKGSGAELYFDVVLPEEKEDWISVLDSLPEKGERVRCKLSRDIGLGTTEKSLYRMKHNGRWNDYHELVTHWKPLSQ